MGGGHSGEGSQDLSHDVTCGFVPDETTLPSIGQSDGRVEMRAGDGSKSEDEGHQRGTGRQRVGEQCDGHVPPGESFAHDAGPNDSDEQKGRAHRLGDNSA